MLISSWCDWFSIKLNSTFGYLWYVHKNPFWAFILKFWALSLYDPHGPFLGWFNFCHCVMTVAFFSLPVELFEATVCKCLLTDVYAICRLTSYLVRISWLMDGSRCNGRDSICSFSQTSIEKSWRQAFQEVFRKCFPPRLTRRPDVKVIVRSVIALLWQRKGLRERRLLDRL